MARAVKRLESVLHASGEPGLKLGATYQEEVFSSLNCDLPLLQVLLPNFQGPAEIGKPLWDAAVVLQNGAFLLQGCDAARGMRKLSLCGNFAPADRYEQCSCRGFASDGSIRYTICISPG